MQSLSVVDVSRFGTPVDPRHGPCGLCGVSRSMLARSVRLGLRSGDLGLVHGPIVVRERAEDRPMTRFVAPLIALLVLLLPAVAEAMPYGRG
jgi:hypothetical protein